MSISTDFANRVCAKIATQLDFQSAPLIISLHTGDPGTAGDDEVTGGGYGRVSVPASSWAAASGGSIITDTNINFTNVPPCTVTHIGVWSFDEEVLIFGEELPDPVTLTLPLSTFRIAAGNLTINVGTQTVHGARTFTDDFNRTNTSAGAGNNWILQGFPNQATMTINANRLLMSGSISAQMFLRCIGADGLYWQDVIKTTFSQYVKATVIGSTGTPRSGPALLLNGTPTTLAAFILGASQGYMLQTAVDSGSLVIVNFSDNSNVGASLGVPVDGDILEMQADVTPSEVTLSVWQNNVLLGTRVDSSVARVTTAGWPGMASGFQSAAQSWDNFECRAER